jgi:general secretion pathway protein A
MTPDPEYLFMTKVHRRVFLGMFDAIGPRKGLVVLTGEAGTGKTTLVRKVLASMPGAKAKFSLVLNPTLTQARFLESMLMDFGIAAPPGEVPQWTQLQQVLLQLHSEGKAAVLVVDDAHKLSAEQLEEIRLLTNLEVPEAKLLQVILVGQKELDSLLDQDSLQQLKQRVAVRLALSPLSALEAEGYVEYRWCQTGAKTKHPFVEDAVRGIACYSHGLPSLINVLCDNALLIAHEDGAALVGEKHVVAAAKHLELLPSSTSEVASVPVVSPEGAGSEVRAAALPPAPDSHSINTATSERVGLSLFEGKEDRGWLRSHMGFRFGNRPTPHGPAAGMTPPFEGTSERRRAPRSHIPTLFVYLWTGGVTKPHKVLDISEIGACFETRDLWPAGTRVELTLQRILGTEGNSADPDTSLRVASKVVRTVPGRLSVQFIYKQRDELLRVRKYLSLSAAAGKLHLQVPT